MAGHGGPTLLPFFPSKMPGRWCCMPPHSTQHVQKISLKGWIKWFLSLKKQGLTVQCNYKQRT